jgi:hypothetical protein
MSATKKNPAKKSLGKTTQKRVVVRHIDAKDTLFPEKVARANRILSHTKFHDPDLLH